VRSDDVKELVVLVCFLFRKNFSKEKRKAFTPIQRKFFTSVSVKIVFLLTGF
jgi:hypothetical protein